MLAILTTHPIQYQVPLWQALAKDGRVPFEVWYLTSHATQPSRDREFGKEFAWDLEMLAGYEHRFLDVAAGATPSSFWKSRLKEKLRDRLRKTGTRALWIQGWQVAAYWQAVWEAKAAGVEVWLRGESNDLAPVPWWKMPIKRAALNELFKRVDRFLYIGSANRRLYQKFGVPNDKLFSAPYAVDNARFAERANELRARRMELRKEWEIPDDAFCVLFCGKFIPKKRPMDLIAAASSLVTRHASLKIHLLFAGSGELGVELRANCNVVFDSENPSLSHVTGHSSLPVASFAGFLNQTEISKAYVTADVLVLPSDYLETWGLVVNEAMASGLPCIISNRCGCAEDLIPNELTFKAGDVEALANTIQGFKSASPPLFRLPSFSTTVDTVAQLFAEPKATVATR
jgi:glycosyltransferase involved in cell wall biosynthesis